MIKIHNEKVKKRKYSQFEKENISLDKNLGKVDIPYENNKNTKIKKLTNYKKIFNTNPENTKIKQNSMISHKHQNFNKNNEVNIIKTPLNTNNFATNNIFVSAKKTNINKTNLQECKTSMKLKSKVEADSKENIEKTNKKVALRINRFDKNQIISTEYNNIASNSTKYFKRFFSTSNEPLKDINSLKPKTSHLTSINRNKSSTSTSATYCPRLFSASVMKKVDYIILNIKLLYLFSGKKSKVSNGMNYLRTVEIWQIMR